MANTNNVIALPRSRRVKKLSSEDFDRAQTFLSWARQSLEQMRVLVSGLDDDFHKWDEFGTTLDRIRKNIEAVRELIKVLPVEVAQQMYKDARAALDAIDLCQTCCGHPAIFVGHARGLAAVIEIAGKHVIHLQQRFRPGLR